MTQPERLDFLIQELLRERSRFHDVSIPSDITQRKAFLRALLNVRPAMPAESEFLRIQDEYLQEENKTRGITSIEDVTPIYNTLYLWRGDITTLRVDAIVNAANNQLLGCFIPCHGCIDNAIHTYSGVQLRLACDDIIHMQGKEETGVAKITKAFNLPCKYVLHTVGPIITGGLTTNDCMLLASCYRSCLTLAEQNHVDSIAFCCISTGEYHFPNKEAAEIAIYTVTQYIAETQSKMKVIFNVFKERDFAIYEQLLQSSR